MSSTFQHCSINIDCRNNGFIIVDTNFIIYLIEAICGRVEAKLRSSSRDDKFNFFKDVLNSMLDSIKTCTLDGTFWTSDLVYDHEMSPLNRISTLRRQAHGFDKMCRQQNSYYRSVDRILKSHISELSINNNDIGSIKNLYSDKFDDEDASLIGVSANKSLPQYKTLLLTDDDGLYGRVEKIVKRTTLNLNGTNYPTEGIFPTNFLNFIERVHDCCKLDSDEFCYCMHHKYIVEDARPNRFLKAKKVKQVERVWYRFTDSLSRKFATLQCA